MTNLDKLKLARIAKRLSANKDYKWLVVNVGGEIMVCRCKQKPRPASVFWTVDKTPDLRTDNWVETREEIKLTEPMTQPIKLND